MTLTNDVALNCFPEDGTLKSKANLPFQGPKQKSPFASEPGPEQSEHSRDLLGSRSQDVSAASATRAGPQSSRPTGACHPGPWARCLLGREQTPTGRPPEGRSGAEIPEQSTRGGETSW